MIYIKRILLAILSVPYFILRLLGCFICGVVFTPIELLLGTLLLYVITGDYHYFDKYELIGMTTAMFLLDTKGETYFHETVLREFKKKHND